MDDSVGLIDVGDGHHRDQGNFSRPIKHDSGRVRAEARVVSQGRQIISSQAQLVAQGERVLAHRTSTIMVLAEDR